MSGFEKTAAFQRQCVTVLGHNETIADVAVEDFFNGLSHFAGGLSGADNDQPATKRYLLAGHNESAIAGLDKFSDAGGRIRRIERGFPNQPRRLPQFCNVHLLLAGSPLFAVGRFLATRARISSTVARSV